MGGEHRQEVYKKCLAGLPLALEPVKVRPVRKLRPTHLRVQRLGAPSTSILMDSLIKPTPLPFFIFHLLSAQGCQWLPLQE